MTKTGTWTKLVGYEYHPNSILSLWLETLSFENENELCLFEGLQEMFFMKKCLNN